MPIYSHLLTASTNYLENVYLERDRLKMWIWSSHSSEVEMAGSEVKMAEWLALS